VGSEHTVRTRDATDRGRKTPDETPPKRDPDRWHERGALPTRKETGGKVDPSSVVHPRLGINEEGGNP